MTTTSPFWPDDRPSRRRRRPGLGSGAARQPGAEARRNDRGQVKSIWAGECDISLGNTYYMGQMIANPEEKPYADAVRIVYPSFENGGHACQRLGYGDDQGRAQQGCRAEADAVPRLGRGAAHLRGNEQRIPVKPGVPRSALVDSWGTFTPDGVNLAELAKLRPAALKIMEEVNFDG